MAFVQVFRKSQYIVLGIHYPGRNDVSHVKVTICTGWSPKFLRVDFLDPGVCGHSSTVSSVGAVAGAGASAGASSAISVFSSFPSENTESGAEVLDYVGMTRSLGILSTELCWTWFLSSLSECGE